MLEKINHKSAPKEVVNALVTLYHQGKFDDVLSRSSQLIKEYPQTFVLHNIMGAISFEKGQKEVAIKHFRKVIELRPHHPHAYNNLGAALIDVGEYEEAKSNLKKAIELQPDYAEAYNNLGNVYKEMEEYNQAISVYEKAIELNPEYYEAHSNLGNTLHELGRLDEAEASYNQAIALKPDYAEAFSNLGNTLHELGRLDKAETSCRQAIALKPDFAAAHSNLGNTFHEQGRLDEAIVSYRQAITLNPDFSEAHKNLGIALSELGRLDEAEASLKKAITLKPDKFADAYDQLGFILQKKGEFDEAEVCFKKCSSLEPKTIPKTVSKGTIFFKQGSFEQALSAFENYDDAMSKGQILESLFALGRVGEIYSRLDATVGLDDENLRIAAIAAFLAKREKKNTAHNFCNNPMDFLHFANISSSIEDYEYFIASVIDELRHVKAKWELNTTRNGFQANVDVFKNPLEKMSMLKRIILDEIDIYYSKFKNESCTYIKKWPSEKNIKGWHVVLKTQGHQTPHIHSTGWLSGVIYLKVVPALGKNEGAIEFSLNGPNYHDKDSPSLIFQPKAGDIVFFPSSLHHRTIPFTTDTDRIIVSFDLWPGEATY